ncbi:hypothetical protein EDB87DRAFT_1679163 [Lactarius vividus]|nr:hypothetical protein EDB87DRAFT_1679163 [Lactarius vividus]
MSQAKLTLRPPPNIDFVQGYPGIPPGAPDRPQAAVKGAIGVRMGPQGVKVKYVRVELRKIETLPGGAQNSFYDFVGQSHQSLAVERGQDITFYIRIPESIPPTLALENGAGIKYELVGQWFLPSQQVILSSSTPITIDKHELHSTWAVFQQHESRQLTQDAVMLTVDRSQNCYGPSDRVAKQLFSVPVLKNSSSQVKINIVGEQKVSVNVTMHGGQVRRSELAVMVTDSHHYDTPIRTSH